jgi:hypothetical protein
MSSSSLQLKRNVSMFFVQDRFSRIIMKHKSFLRYVIYLILPPYGLIANKCVVPRFVDIASHRLSVVNVI